MGSGGEYEDSYDPQFQIYNDVLVEFPDGNPSKLFTYPRSVFPPTDDHVGIQLGSSLYLFGNVGYPEDRVPQMQVVRIDLLTYQAQCLQVPGPGPPWCSKRNLTPPWNLFNHWNWLPPQDLHLHLSFCAADGARTEAFIGNMLFGPIVRLEGFETIDFTQVNTPFNEADAWFVGLTELPSEGLQITSTSFEFIEDSSYGRRWIIVKITDKVCAIYQPACQLLVGMSLDVNEDAWGQACESDDSDPPPVRVLTSYGDFCGVLRSHNSCYHEATGLIPLIDKSGLGIIDSITDAGTRIVDDVNVEDFAETLCVYRPLPLMLAKAIVQDAEKLNAKDRLVAAKHQLKLEEEAVLAEKREWADKPIRKLDYIDTDVSSILRLEDNSICLAVYSPEGPLQKPTMWRLDTKVVAWHTE